MPFEALKYDDAITTQGVLHITTILTLSVKNYTDLENYTDEGQKEVSVVAFLMEFWKLQVNTLHVIAIQTSTL